VFYTVWVFNFQFWVPGSGLRDRESGVWFMVHDIGYRMQAAPPP